MSALLPLAPRVPTAAPCSLHTPALQPRVGTPCEAVGEGSAFLQPFTEGLLLWRADTRDLLMLHSDGRLVSYAVGGTVEALGEPLAPAERVALCAQRCQHATLLWTAHTGLLTLFPHRWQLLLEATA